MLGGGDYTPFVVLQRCIEALSTVLALGLSGLLTWHLSFQHRISFPLESYEKLDTAVNTGTVAVAYTPALQQV